MDGKKIKKSDYRTRAHCNPFMDREIFIPSNPDSIDWSTYYPSNTQPTILDIGCGYGNFLFEISKIFPEKMVLGLEIRKIVKEFVEKKIESQRLSNKLFNCSVINTNAMIFLPNFFKKCSIEKIFVLFPDPHFKKKKKKARLISYQITHLIDYLLCEDGKIYLSTDVEELFISMCESFSLNNCFKQLSLEECENDILFKMTYTRTDESKRAAIKTGKTFATIFLKIN